MKNVKCVTDKRLCTGCGGCAGICPVQCITTELSSERGFFITHVDDEKCIACGLCTKICPIYSWDNTHCDNPLVGRQGEAFSCFACDNALRYSCASGGFTTSLLIWLFRQKSIDAAVTVSRNKVLPLQAEPRICTTEDEILSSKGSVYTPVSYADIFRTLLKGDYRKVAVVGLPCHIQAMSGLEQASPKLKERIFIKISLVCGHTPSLKGYEYSLRRLGIQKDRIVGLTNRGNGWPGVLKITLNTENQQIKIGHGSYLSWGTVLSSPLFTPDGCSHCVDSSGYQADISVSDAWLPKFKDDGLGRNLIYVRSSMASEIVRKMEKDGIIALENETVEDFIRANSRVFKEKLVLNGYKNRRLVEKYFFFRNVTFLPVKSFLGTSCACLFVCAENLYKRMIGSGINRIVLFVFKTLKYLSVKWLKISC